MTQLVSQSIINSLNKRITYLESKSILKLTEYATKHKISIQNLINKANRGTIPAFRDKGVWMIGDQYKVGA